MRNIVLLSLLLSSTASAEADPSARYVFFDWGKEELTNDAKATLDTVASDYAGAPRGVTIDGHSDRSGSAEGNWRRSRERARLVADYLMTKGIPATRIDVQAYGESRPIIQTEDGVREVQNRRVEIRFRAD